MNSPGRFPCGRVESYCDRRRFLQRAGGGLGILALADLLGRQSLLADDKPASGAAALPPPHFPAKAKSVIWLFMEGAPSAVDMFDPKPELDKNHGKKIAIDVFNGNPGPLMRSPFKFQQYGESGIPVSEIFQHTARHIDDIAVIRSMHADVPNHEPSLLLMNCGESRLVRPSMGSWLTYGLGTENLNLPGFIAMVPGGYPIVETQNWQSAFLPGVYQGTYVNTQFAEIDKLKT